MNPILNLVMNLITLLLFSKVSCSSDFYDLYVRELQKIHSEDLLKRTELMNELISLEDSIKKSANSGDQEKTQTLLKRLEDIWLKVVNISENIPPALVDADTELRLQEFRNLTAHLLFITRSRHCESPDETFYKPMNQCLLIGRAEHCPEYMILNDGPDNEGFCDCMSYNKQLLFFSQTGLCYRQNSQGPCQNGEWIILQNGTPQCQPVPEGCPADGKHVYWSPNETLAKQCWELGTVGPCLFPAKLLGSGGLDVFCGSQTFPSLSNVAPLRRETKCNPGSYLDQKLQCRPSFF